MRLKSLIQVEYHLHGFHGNNSIIADEGCLYMRRKRLTED